LTEFVVDCSITGAWFLDESNTYALNILDKLTPHSSLWVPVLWHYEFANMLTVARRQTSLSKIDTDNILRKIKLLPFKIDVPSSSNRDDIIELSMQYNLTAYDAAYLELCLRKTLSLSTLDRQLITAAKKAGARLLS
jgi:predicted nucleic acid-binding protein